MKCKIYITDEGFGPIVRQSAIIEAMQEMSDDVFFEVQTKTNMELAKKVIPNASFQEKHNIIGWAKTKEGSPDIHVIKSVFDDYIERSDQFITEELKSLNADFIITDFCYEAFEIGYQKSIPVFGVAHFTWDWFFSKLYPCPLKKEVLDRFVHYSRKAETLYFPPFTSKEIIDHYSDNVYEVPMIVRKHKINQKKISSDKFNVFIIDSGAGVLNESIEKAIKRVEPLKNFQFYLSSNFSSSFENITVLQKNELLLDYIAQMDLVIGRAGFNTISECITSRTPMLLIAEAMNPEMAENIVNIKYTNLGSFISLDQFCNNLEHYLPKFIDTEYKLVVERMKNHQFELNGAKIVAQSILEKMKIKTYAYE